MRIAALVVAVALAASPALAQSPPTDPRHEFELGMSAYEDGRFEDALRHFERAYELTGEPDLLYNIATVDDRLRRDAAALDAYQRYLAARPDGPDRFDIEGRIEVLRASIATEATPDAAAPAVAPPDPAPEAEPEPTLDAEPAMEVAAPAAATIRDDASVIAWTLFGVGLAATAAGVGVLFAAQGDADASRGSTDWLAVREAYERVPMLDAVGGTLLVAGIGSALAGVVWAATPSTASGSESARVAVTPFGVSLQGSF